jgi:hypothetical protein
MLAVHRPVHEVGVPKTMGAAGADYQPVGTLGSGNLPGLHLVLGPGVAEPVAPIQVDRSNRERLVDVARQVATAANEPGRNCDPTITESLRR